MTRKGQGAIPGTFGPFPPRHIPEPHVRKTPLGAPTYAMSMFDHQHKPPRTGTPVRYGRPTPRGVGYRCNCNLPTVLSAISAVSFPGSAHCRRLRWRLSVRLALVDADIAVLSQAVHWGAERIRAQAHDYACLDGSSGRARPASPAAAAWGSSR
eukprot:3992238-Prymnesium_polylepis.1